MNIYWLIHVFSCNGRDCVATVLGVVTDTGGSAKALTKQNACFNPHATYITTTTWQTTCTAIFIRNNSIHVHRTRRYENKWEVKSANYSSDINVICLDELPSNYIINCSAEVTFNLINFSEPKIEGQFGINPMLMWNTTTTKTKLERCWLASAGA